jgi:hypothetical protein
MRILTIFLFIFSFTGNLFATSYKEVPNGAFGRGEKLRYVVYYKTFLTGKIKAGEITLEIKNDNRKFNGRSTYHIEAIGQTRHSLKWLMKVDDRFESYIDEKALFPWLFIRKTREGNYTKDDQVEFSPYHNIAVSTKATKNTPPNVQDIVSAFYFARTSDLSKLRPEEHFSIPIFLDDSVYNSAIIFQKRELTQTSAGKFNCVRFKPMVVTGNVFSNKYPMTVWISDDDNKIPIRIESSLFIGRVEVELVESKGLSNPLTSKVD